MKAQNLSNGRVAHYPIIGNFNDVVGNNNGIVFGANLTEDRFGNPNSAYQLDGINDYIRIPHHANINFAYNEDFTISIWVKLAASQNDLRGNNNDVIRKWNSQKSSGYPYAIGYRNSLWPDERLNKIYVARYDSEVCSDNPSITNSCKIPTEFWHHIIMKKQGDVITSYQDGVIEGTTNDSTSPSCTTENTNDVTIGQRGSNLRYLTGAIDDLMFYDRALTENEISSLFQENGWVRESFENEFTSFTIQGQTNQTIIDNINHTISLELPCNKDVSSLIAQFNTSKESIITVANEIQITGVNTNNFTTPLIYTISNDLYCFIQDWTVTINLESYTESEKTIATSFINFNIPNQIGNTSINNIDHVIEIQMPCYTDVTNIVAYFDLPIGTVATINNTRQISSINSNDFSNPIIYTLYNEGLCHEQDWVVNINLESYTENEKTIATSFINFNIPTQIGNTSINNIDHVIEIQVPCYTDVTNLIANYELQEGTIIIFKDVEQFSGITANNFSNPIMLSLLNNQKCTSSTWLISVTYNFKENIDFQSISYFIPNVITPNHDFLNEKFVIGNNLIGSEITILNRYGKSVFESTHYINNFSGKNLSSGVYYYRIRNKCIKDPIIGPLQIIK